MPPESCRRRDHFELESRGKCNSGGQIQVALNDGGLQGSGKHREVIVRNGMDKLQMQYKGTSKDLCRLIKI